MAEVESGKETAFLTYFRMSMVDRTEYKAKVQLLKSDEP